MKRQSNRVKQRRAAAAVAAAASSSGGTNAASNGSPEKKKHRGKPKKGDDDAKMSVKEIQDLQQALAASKAEKAKLEKQLNSATAMASNLSASSGKASKNGINREMEIMMEKNIKLVSFKNCKFVSNDEQMNQFVEQVLDDLDLEGFDKATKEGLEKRQVWKATHGDRAITCQNQCRNYVTTQMKKAVEAYLATSNGQLPTLDSILQCAQRKLNIKDPINQETFQFYYEILLPKANGYGSDFSEKVRYYATISTAKSDDSAKYIDMTIATEAFGVITYENNYKKWMKEYELNQNPARAGRQTRIVNLGNENNAASNNPEYYHIFERDHKELISEYTKSNAGQEKYGGWTEKGMNRFIVIRRGVKAGRAKAYGKQWEADALTLMRQIRNITGKNYADQRRIQGKVAKGKVAKAASVGVVDLMESDPDDDQSVDLTQI